MSKLNLSAIFKSAHLLTRSIKRKGDSYSATFALCLKQVIAHAKGEVVTVTSFMRGVYFGKTRVGEKKFMEFRVGHKFATPIMFATAVVSNTGERYSITGHGETFDRDGDVYVRAYYL